jgi:hypothetical protein
MSLLYLLSALLLGTAISRSLGIKYFKFEMPAMAVSLGLITWTWLSFVTALVLPYAFSLPATVGISACISVTCMLKSAKWQYKPLPGGMPAWVIWAVFSITATLLLAWLMWTHYLISSSDGLYSANATWADFGLHSSLITHFAGATRLPLDLPVAAGTKLTYPFMNDLLSGWLAYGGWSLHLAIFLPSILLIASFLQLMLGFGVRLFGRIGGAALGLTLSLFCGSTVGIFSAFSDYTTSHLSLIAFLNHLPQDYTALSSPNAQVTNLIADAILPQRSFLMGFSTFAAIIILFTHLRTFPSSKLAIFTGCLIGLLPLVHSYTFVVLMGLVASFWIESELSKHPAKSTWLITGLAGLLVAIPQLLWQSFANHNGTGGHVSLGWTIAPGESIVTFWSNNYGPTLLILIGIIIALFSVNRLRRYITWYLPIVLIFISANIYSLQPFAYDNLKLILYCYIFIYIFASYGALWLIRKFSLAVIPTALIIILITSSGTLAVLREFQHRDLFASSDDIALAKWAKTSTLNSDVFIATDRPNQPLATLAGRSIVAGYRGWLYNFNIDYQPRLADVSLALQGRLTANNAYSARFLAVNTYEGPEWTIDTAKMQANYRIVYSNASWIIYRLPR